MKNFLRKPETKKAVFKRALPLCLALSMSFSLAGCGKKKDKEIVPELKETTVTNESYRPVTRGNVGDFIIMPARVVPRSYGQFYNKAQDISEIYYDIGDYVEKGDKVASADTTEIDETIKEFNRSISDLEREIEQYKKSSDLTLEYLEYEKKACLDMGDTAGAEAKEKEIETEKENRSYRLTQYEKSEDNFYTELNQAKEDREKLVLYATHSGYVTYKMNLADGSHRESYENVIMISDYEDIYVEAETVTINKFGKYRSAAKMEAMIDGKKYKVEEDVFSTAANNYAVSTEKYPRVRFKIEGASYKLGDVIPIFIYMYCHEDVLMVGNDSIRNDGNDKYVFVAGEEDEMEKRMVEVGYSDSIYTEIISGLEEGENVYYLSDSLKPIKYEEVTVGRSNYVQYEYSDSAEMISTKSDIYSMPVNGKFLDYEVAGNKFVESDVMLFQAKASVSDAELLDKRQNIEQTKKQHEKTVEEENKRLEELNQALENVGKEPAPAATDTDAIRDSLYKKERLELEKEMLLIEMEEEQDSYDSTIDALYEEYNKLSNIADNDGIVSVYSKREGIVRFFDNDYYRHYYYSSGDTQKGTPLMAIEYGDADKLLVKTVRNTGGSDNEDYTKRHTVARPGTKLYITGGGKELTGECIGNIGDNADSKVYYIEELDGHIYITSCPETIYHDIGTGYFARIDNVDMSEAAEFGKAVSITFETVSMKNAIVIPKDCVYTEKASGGTVYYVWVKEGNDLTKRFIDYVPDYSSNDSALILGGLSEGEVIVKEEKEAGK
ncbi:MAG: hypothetical protein IJ703_11235 [Eubacterium sp.]|nr:hypothetical protein [Eubacterium sp.]